MLISVFRSLITITSVILSLGLTMHDSGIDHAYAVAIERPSLASYLESEQQLPQKPLHELRPQHAHADYNPLGDTLAKTFSYQSPTVGPRRNSHHKQLLRLLAAKGRHAFDDIHMPVLT